MEREEGRVVERLRKGGREGPLERGATDREKDIQIDRQTDRARESNEKGRGQGDWQVEMGKEEDPKNVSFS